MWALGAFLVFISAAVTKTSSDKHNASRPKREAVQLQREERKAFDKMMKTSDRLARKGK